MRHVADFPQIQLGLHMLEMMLHQPRSLFDIASGDSLNDFIVFGCVAVGSFISGSLLATYDWSTVLWVSFVPLAFAIAVLGGISRTKL